MRTAVIPMTLRTLLAVVALFATSLPAAAQKPKAKITSARVGLPPGAPTADPIAKFATWAPVYVELEVLDDIPEPAELVVEAADADEVTTTLSVPVPVLVAARAGQRFTPADLGILPYTRPAGGNRNITVLLRATTGVALSEPFRVPTLNVRDPRTYVVLSLNGRLAGFDLPKPAAGQDVVTAPLRDGRVELAAITSVDELPDQWFGYDAADLVVLSTTADEFLRRLFGEQARDADKARRAALLEWVRRGGRLVVTVGQNAGLVDQLPTLRDLLPATIPAASPGGPVSPLVFDWRTREGNLLNGVLAARGAAPIAVANLMPRADKPSQLLVQARPDGDRTPQRLAVQAAVGLGRVTVVAFDLDRAPFTAFDKRADFWEWVLREGGAAKASVGPEGKTHTTTVSADDEDDVSATLRRHVDTFDGVPVISFGWVAVLIVLYIVLIGPVEYYFLKKVLGRLELTWITFPIIVVTVSAAAYVTAYSVKGRDLKVNKVDVIDVDPAGGHVYGTSLFTVFSPRTDTYTVGVTPADGWTADPNTPGGSLVGWVGSKQAGRPGLMRRKYQFHVGPGAVADGLDGVPVQVWSTKSFTACWAGRMNPAAPVVESRLVHPPGDPDRIIGNFVNRMPFDEVRDCVLFYGGQVYALQPGGSIFRGQTVPVVLDRGQPATKWLQDEGQLGKGQFGAKTGAETGGSTLPLWGVLFHEAALKNDEGVFPRNASLRRLDQSWRLSKENRDEVILVGRVLPPVGPAEDVLGGAASPTRVWLKELPGANATRTPIVGTARQETYVRVYLPVKPAGADR